MRSKLELMMFSSLALCLFLLYRLTFGLPDHRPLSPHHEAGKRGAVSSLDRRCSAIGADILNQGGNAADSAIATEFCLGVVGLHLTGIGGGGFVLVRSVKGTHDFIDFRETAPAASSETMFDGNVDASLSGGLASAIPGEVKGLYELHLRYGRLTWDKLLEPSIKLARDGFIIGKDLGFYMDTILSDEVILSSAWAPDFAPNGKRLKAGDRTTRKRYAKALQSIAERGPAAFYTGPMAQAIVEALKKEGGIMTLEDLAGYETASRRPASIDYRDFRIISSGAPSGGSVVLKILKTMAGYNGVGDPAYLNITTHRLDEAFRFAYGARTKLGDPTFVEGLHAYEEAMLSEDTAVETRSKIRDDRTLPIEAYNPDGFESFETPGTSHVSAADSSGLAISLTSTVNLVFGSQLMVPENGILMNNEMNDFSLPNSSDAFGYIPSPANYIRPGKRPMSSMSPVIVEFLFNDKLYLVTGGAGGSRIITATAQSLWNVLDRGMNLSRAIEEPRFHDQLVPNQVVFESAFDSGRIAFLEGKGHVSGRLDHGSDLQMVRRHTDGKFEAASETRQQDSGGVVA
ncbi:gamma-glutamyltransferase [Triangularia verruculosa]|uniref:Glutathione hydrolase n=1 Tax=Triangularia verruculosa TaxID=2587418 RepID=A0AAN6XIN5_9PEZI|nr:gamma-glutamyltransferase [Triangularia verruculosa]